MTLPDGRRRRAALSCVLCRKRKLRCNRETPCGNCLRARSDTCVYDNATLPSSAAGNNVRQAQAAGRVILPRGQDEHAIDSSSTTSSMAGTGPSRIPDSRASGPSSKTSPGSQDAAVDTESARLKQRIRQLEEQLSISAVGQVEPTRSTSSRNMESTTTQFGGTMHITLDSSTPGKTQPIARSIFHKTRLLGRSHWCVNGILMIRDIFESIDVQARMENSNAINVVEKCKSIARVIKAGRAPPWPCPPTRDLPTKNIADALVDNYLRTSESIYRVLHIPSFRRDYDALWVSNSSPKIAFIVQLKLVLAIGAITYDGNFSLRRSAFRWVYEAQTWVSEPKFKSRLDIPSLQTHILLLLAQEGVGTAGENMWISIGALMRKTMFMGLHNDPAALPSMPTFAQEMRRRLWNTIIELAVQSSLTSGGPPLISVDQFTTTPPGNFDDDQLMIDQAVPKGEDEFTQVSIAIALRKTFPQRLAVVKLLNDASSASTYQETLRLDSDLRASFKELRQSLQTGRTQNNKRETPTKFEMCMLDFLLHRYLLALHGPYFGPAFRETAYAYSRTVVVESALRIWHSVSPDSSSTSSSRDGDNPSNHANGLWRLATCSSGFYPSGTIQALCLIGLELRGQVHEDDSLGPAPLRPDLLSALDGGMSWCMRTIEAGETNMKGCLLIRLLAFQIDACRAGMEPAAIAHSLMEEMEDVGNKCLAMLEEAAAADGNDKADDNHLEQVSLTPSEGMEDWGFMMADVLLDGNNMETMNWIFD